MHTILVVDDEKDTAGIIAEQLEASGFAVRLAYSGEAGLALLKDGVDADAIVSDILLAKGMNGLQFARAVRATRPQLPVLLATGFDFAAEIAELRGVRAISKPFSSRQIAALLNEMIDGGASTA
jgi:two-component system, NtrC family, sensor kinase